MATGPLSVHIIETLLQLNDVRIDRSGLVIFAACKLKSVMEVFANVETDGIVLANEMAIDESRYAKCIILEGLFYFRIKALVDNYKRYHRRRFKIKNGIKTFTMSAIHPDN